MQLDIAAIKGGFPEGVWPGAVFQFLLERGYLTVVCQGDIDFLFMEGASAEPGTVSGSLLAFFRNYANP